MFQQRKKEKKAEAFKGFFIKKDPSTSPPKVGTQTLG